jgi:hypothetical protein
MQKGKKLALSVEYLQELTNGKLSVEVREENLNCPFFVNHILKLFACVSAKNLSLKVSQGIKEGMSEKQVWDTYAGISLTEGALAHCIFTIHTFFLQRIMKIQADNLKTVMKKLCVLWGIEKILERASQVYVTGIITPEAFQIIHRKRESLLL